MTHADYSSSNSMQQRASSTEDAVGIVPLLLPEYSPKRLRRRYCQSFDCTGTTNTSIALSYSRGANQVPRRNVAILLAESLNQYNLNVDSIALFNLKAFSPGPLVVSN